MKSLFQKKEAISQISRWRGLPLIFQKTSVEFGTVSVLADRLSRHHRVVPSASLDKSKIIIQLLQSNKTTLVAIIWVSMGLSREICTNTSHLSQS